MEGDEHRRRQYEQLNYSQQHVPGIRTQGTNVSNFQHLRGAQGSEDHDRFRQAQLLTTQPPTAAGATSPQDLGNFGYASGHQYATPQMQETSFPYQPGYVQETQRQRQLPQYTSQMMYDVPQHPQPQPQPPSPYDTVGHYQQPRQTAAVEVLSSQFGVPQFFNAGEGANQSGDTAIPSHYPTAAYPQHIQYNDPGPSLGRSTLASPYPTIPRSFSHTAPTEAPGQPQQGADMFAQYYDRYQRALRETNENTAKGNIIEAGKSLSTMSEWLLTHANELGIMWIEIGQGVC